MLRAILQQMTCITPAHLRRHPLRFALSAASIAMASGLFVSMRISQESIVAAFNRNLDALAGGATHRLRGAGGVSPDALSKLERIDGVRAAPVLSASAILGPQRLTVMVLGVDLAREARLRPHRLTEKAEVDLATLLLRPRAVVIPASLAARCGLKMGEVFEISTPQGLAELTVAGLLTADGPAAALGGNVMVMGIAEARRLFDRGDVYDRIDFALDAHATLDQVRAAVGPEYSIESVRGEQGAFEHIYIQFQTILVCVSILAGVIALFIVYNTMSLSVVQRARDIATLRALGARRHEILLVFTAEAALLGLVASIAGALIGRAAAGYVLADAARTVSIMMELGEVTLVTPWDIWLIAPLVGLLAAAAGAVMPARAAAMLPPTAAMRPAELALQLAMRARLWLVVGVVLIVACLVLVHHPETEWTWTVVGVGLGLVGLAMCGPQILVWLTPSIQRLGAGFSSVPAMLALDNIVKFPSRTSLTTFALGGSLSLVVAISALVAGMQRELDDWMRQIFVFELIAQGNDLTRTAYPAGTFPADLLDEVRRHPSCSAAYGVRIVRLDFRGDEPMLIAYEPETFERIRLARGVIKDPEHERARTEALRSGKIAVSRNFARLHRVDSGDRITLKTPSGEKTFEIDNVQTDYSWFRGCIFMDMEIFRELWKSRSLSYLDIAARPDADLAAFQAELVEKWGNRYGLFVYRTDQLREHAARYTYEWFALANAQLILAVVIGGVGVANTLLVSVLTQTRQIGLLRAIGASTGQIQRMLLGESVVLGVMSGVTGCLMGLATVAFLVAPMGIKATGFDFPLLVPYGSMALAFFAAVVIALGAGIWPLRAVRRIDIIQAIGYE